MSITELEQRLAALPDAARAAAARIYDVRTTTGRLVAPDALVPWIERQFGSLDAVREQRIVRVTDRVLLEGALFNELRSRRPIAVPAQSAADVAATIAASAPDPFCDVLVGTPADTFGRIRGPGGTTAANVAKYDGAHGVLVFDAHDPLVAFDERAIAGHFATARRWAEAAVAADPEARYWFLLWNCLWRGGGSIVHGHMQMTATRGMHYPRVERLRQATVAYRAAHGGDYLADVWRVHEALGLGVVVGPSRVFATLTPVKEREVVVLGPPGGSEADLAAGVAHALATLRGLGVLAHDLGLFLPPLRPDGADWSRVVPLARLVDRGDPGSRTCDIGAMELYAASVIAADPFTVGAALRGDRAR